MVLVLLIIHADRNTVGYLPYAMHRNHRNRRQIMVTKGERVCCGPSLEALGAAVLASALDVRSQSL